MDTSELKTYWWPDILNEETARKVAMQGAGVSWLVAVVTAVIAVGGWMGAGPGALLDAALFTGVGFGIKMMSRLAAVGGLALYVVERLFAITHGSGSAGMAITVFITMALVNAVRATMYFNDQPQKPKTSVPNGLYIPPKAN